MVLFCCSPSSSIWFCEATLLTCTYYAIIIQYFKEIPKKGGNKHFFWFQAYFFILRRRFLGRFQAYLCCIAVVVVEVLMYDRAKQVLHRKGRLY